MSLSKRHLLKGGAALTLPLIAGVAGLIPVRAKAQIETEKEIEKINKEDGGTYELTIEQRCWRSGHTIKKRRFLIDHYDRDDNAAGTIEVHAIDESRGYEPTFQLAKGKDREVEAHAVVIVTNRTGGDIGKNYFRISFV